MGEVDSEVSSQDYQTESNPIEAWLPITKSRKGNAYTSSFHLICSGIGLQALSLPIAFAALGWWANSLLFTTYMNNVRFIVVLFGMVSCCLLHMSIFFFFFFDRQDSGVFMSVYAHLDLIHRQFSQKQAIHGPRLRDSKKKKLQLDPKN